jgi:predicted DCC family thiol-disulfide oxidoreductase YuxK
MNKTIDKPIIFFDGICNLCNSSVQFIIKRDTNNLFLFSSLQSDAAKDILLQYKLENYDLSSIILLEDGVMYQKSTAILKIARKLTGISKYFYVFKITPTFIRDGIYTFIAKNRYKWFGKRASCMLPSTALKSRFLA